MHRLWILVLTLALTGCGKQPMTNSAGTEKPAGAALPAADPAPPAPATGNVLKGKVLERLDASSYSYLRLSTAEGEVWAAVPQTPLEIGTEVTIGNASQMDGFESKTLKRKFDKIIFGTLGTQNEGAATAMAAQSQEAVQPMASHGGAAKPADPMQDMRQQHAGAASAVNSEPIKVEKASGAEGRTVAEIFDQKSSLSDKKVAVRGKVVKVNSNIMGKTWIHLRDGTGKRDANTDDITVTTKESATVGDTVLVKGTIRTNKDFGMGYSYAVIIEDATVMK